MSKKTICRFLLVLLATVLLTIPLVAQNNKQSIFGILVDNSSSLEKQFPQIIMLGKEVAKRTQPRGTTLLFNFTYEQVNRSGRLGLSSAAEWSQDLETLNSYLDDLSAESSRVKPLYDAMDSMAQLLNSKFAADSAAFNEKVIIVITDGYDSWYDFIPFYTGKMVINGTDIVDNKRKVKNRLIKFLKDSRIKLYAIGITQGLDTTSSFGSNLSKRGEAEEFLRRVTKETGGRVVFPRSKNLDPDKVLNELFVP